MSGGAPRIAAFKGVGDTINVILVMILCLAGSPERCETIRPAEWPALVTLLRCGVFGQHFASLGASRREASEQT